MVGGDFNCLLNPLIDKFPSGIASLSPQARSLKAICDDLVYADVWITFHPSNREITFFSVPHGCQTRIDYFLMPRIGSIVISDHAEVILDMKLNGAFNLSRHWRLNTTILKDHTFTSYFIRV